MTEAERFMTITYDEYACARNALDTLVRERTAILPRGLEALREWLAAGAGERWQQHEEVVQQARLADQALSMWWEYEWRRERNRRQRAEEKARWRAEAKIAAKGTEPGNGAAEGSTAPLEKSRSQAAAPRAPTPARSFLPSGPSWRA